MTGDVCTITVKPDVFEWLTRGTEEPNLEGETSDLKVARIPRSGTHWIGEGICLVCGLVVPIWKANHRTISHWPDIAAHSYDGNPDYFCSGSNEYPLEILGPTQRLTLYTIEWAPDTTGGELIHESREWAAAISSDPTVAKVNLRIFNSERRS